MRTLYYAVAAQSYFGLKGIMALMIYLLYIGQEVCIGKTVSAVSTLALYFPQKLGHSFPIDQPRPVNHFFIPNCYFLNVTVALVTSMG